MRRTSATKKRVGRFREYADALFEKREMVEVMSKLIGDILLDDELRRESEHDRDDEVRRGWEEVHWQPPHACAAATTHDIEKSERSMRAAARLFHRARQRTDTSRWWSMRWPSGAVLLLGQACDLDTGNTYALLRQLREHSASHLR